MNNKELEHKMLLMGCCSIIALVIVIGIVVAANIDWYETNQAPTETRHDS